MHHRSPNLFASARCRGVQLRLLSVVSCRCCCFSFCASWVNPAMQSCSFVCGPCNVRNKMYIFSYVHYVCVVMRRAPQKFWAKHSFPENCVSGVCAPKSNMAFQRHAPFSGTAKKRSNRDAFGAPGKHCKSNGIRDRVFVSRWLKSTRQLCI